MSQILNRKTFVKLGHPYHLVSRERRQAPVVKSEEDWPIESTTSVFECVEAWVAGKKAELPLALRVHEVVSGCIARRLERCTEAEMLVLVY